MNVEGQYNPKDVECIPVENLEVLPSGADWQSRHLESERRKAEIRDRIHKQTEQGQKTAKDYFRPAKPTPSIYDSDLKRVAVYARVSTSSEEQISSIENQTLYYTKKIAETENWNLQDIYSDEGKSGTSLRKRDAFKRMMRDAKDQKMDLIICASISRFARNFSDCMTQIAALKTMHPAHPIGVYFETENIYTLNPTTRPFDKRWFDGYYFAKKIYVCICEKMPKLEADARYQLLSSCYFLVRQMDNQKVRKDYPSEYRMIKNEIHDLRIDDILIV